MSSVQTIRTANGKIGELLVELELTARGWHVERLDGASKAANGDLIAIKGRKRVIIQVKTNGTQKDRGFLGYAGPFLADGVKFYNAKDAVIQTDVVVSVSGDRTCPFFHVFLVDEAETFAQREAVYWFGVAKKDGETRSRNFPVSPKHERLTEFRDAWEKLEN